MATTPKSRKVAELRRDPRVTLHYFDEKGPATVSLQGRARLVDDPKAKAAHWKADWNPFHPERERGALMIQVEPERIEVSSPAQGVPNDPGTWAAPVIEFKILKPKR
jgi:general stress protein 26